VLNNPQKAIASGAAFRNIFVLESLTWFGSVADRFDPSTDLVMTYDFALRHKIVTMGGMAEYIDHLLDSDFMQRNNFLVSRFFKDWHKSGDGSDLFTHQGIPFGFSFRLEIWNDLIFYVRNRLCLERLREFKFDALFVGTRQGFVEEILSEMDLSFTPVDADLVAAPAYFFPIQQWLDEKIRIKSAKHYLRDWVTSTLGHITAVFDTMTGARSKPAIFVQEYYSTSALLQVLKKDSRLRLVLANYSYPRKPLNFLNERVIPFRFKPEYFQEEADDLMRRFAIEKSAKLVLANGLDITEHVYRVIETRIGSCIVETLRVLQSVIHFLDRNPLKLEILIANLGQIATLVDCVCQVRNVPSYLIINGYLGHEYFDEGKYASHINSYSESIKKHYFGDKDNVVCLGDPRMDAYGVSKVARKIDRVKPTITIGASGFNNTDLNSYAAVEFDFLYDILLAIRNQKKQGLQAIIVIKVRSNGYRHLYAAFVEEYFSDLAVEILDNIPMQDVLTRTDLYISIYSQTLFEASCLGIPCVYYKNDTEVIQPPFDGNSELVTAHDFDSLSGAFADFYAGHSRFDAFLQRSVLEKYIGPLDGKNLERNLAYVGELLDKCNERHA
jgi:hypothetical protein